jgi:chromosomal replication initiator protein
MQSSSDALWRNVRPSLLSHFGDKAYQGWLRFLEFSDFDAGRIYLSAPSAFTRDWIATRYLSQLLALFQSQDASVHSLEIIVRPQEPSAPQHAPNDRDHQGPLGTSAASVALPPPLEELSLDDIDEPHYMPQVDARFTFETFVVGKPNELAYAAAHRVADAESVYFNPLFLYGGVGLGKTHLMHAIASHIRT